MPGLIRGSDVTVVVPTIDGREDLLREALASVDRQQIKPARVVVVKDEFRRGATWARNEGLRQVDTEWIAWLDDDDLLLPNHLKVLLRGANQSRADLVFTYPEFHGIRDPLACVNDRGELVPEPINIKFGPTQEWGLRHFGNFIPITYLVRTEMVRRAGGFPEPYSFTANASHDCEDYGLLLHLLDVGARFHHVCGVRTWVYRVHGGNVGGRGVGRMHELGDLPGTA